ncbi:MAG: hypothetical protein ABIH72_02330 [archaeon]
MKNKELEKRINEEFKKFRFHQMFKEFLRMADYLSSKLTTGESLDVQYSKQERGGGYNHYYNDEIYLYISSANGDKELAISIDVNGDMCYIASFFRGYKERKKN